MQLLEERLAQAIANATPAGLDLVWHAVNRAWGASQLPDAAADRLFAEIDGKRKAARLKRATIFTTGRPRPCMRDRTASQRRRRDMAFAGWLPGWICAEHGLTMGEIAVLAVVAAELVKTGRCALPIAAIAARAGVCHRLAQSALRRGQAAGLVSIEERPRPGQPSLTNVIRIEATAWLRWLKPRRKKTTRQGRGEGAETSARPVNQYIQGKKTVTLTDPASRERTGSARPATMRAAL